MQQLQQLKNESIRIEKGMLAYWSNTDRTQELDPDKYVGKLKHKKIFAVAGKSARKKVIGYAYKGEMYVTPYTKEAVQTVRGAGYAVFAFFVPLSPEEMSLIDEEPAAKWQSLIAKFRPSHKPDTDLEVRWSTQPAVAAV